jgi:cyclomaltodextrinase
MTTATPSVLDTQAALLERQSDPIHTPPPAQSLRGEVELTLRGKDAQPEVVVRDRRREVVWRVAMQPVPDEPGAWTARLRMPSVPTVLLYHFEFEDKTTFYALRQVEGLVPASPYPIFGQWVRRPFQIAVYDPALMPAPWTRAQVIYQIFPDRFAKGELSNDPLSEKVAKNTHGRDFVFLDWDQPPELPPKGRDFHCGNIPGIISKLDYLKGLGIDCVYLTPIFESPTNHRYDAMDYFKIDPLLGTEADLRQLVAEVHSRGMRIILDAVFNHCSNDSRYYNAAGWYGPDVGATKDKQSPYYRWFEFLEWPDKYNGWIGVRSMPEFVECPEVEEFFLGPEGVSNYWLSTGIDGWRTDVTPWMTEEFWRRFRRSVRAAKPDAYTVAEEWNDASHYLVGECFDATMNYRLAWALRGFFALDALTVTEFADRLDNLVRDTPSDALLSQMNLIDSHDTARALSVCGGDKGRFTQMVAFLLAYPGSPLVCYGDEVGLTGDFAEDSRKSFPWDGGDLELRQFYQDALAFRRSSAALRYGSFEPVIADEAKRVYVFARRLDGETVYAAFNASDSPTEVAIPLHADEDGTWRDGLGRCPDQTCAAELRFTLEARGAAWFAHGGE